VNAPLADHQVQAALLRPGKSRGRGLRYKAGAVTVVTAGLAAMSLLAGSGAAVAAPAAPKPTVAEVQKKIADLNVKADKLDQQLNQVKQELSSASQRLKVVNHQAARYSKQFNEMRAEIGRIAAQAYMQGSLNSSLVLLTSDNPQQILNQSSILLELSSSNTAEMDKFISAAKSLTSAQKAARHTKAGIATLRRSLAKRKAALDKLIANEKTLLASLTPTQRKGTGPGGGTTPAARLGQRSGREGRLVRLRPARLPLRVRRDRPVQLRVRLLRAHAGRVGVRGRLDPAGQLRPDRQPAARLAERAPARRHS
jgi:hypothetical protein